MEAGEFGEHQIMCTKSMRNNSNKMAIEVSHMVVLLIFLVFPALLPLLKDGMIKLNRQFGARARFFVPLENMCLGSIIQLRKQFKCNSNTITEHRLYISSFEY